jgi:hypothetical protein
MKRLIAIILILTLAVPVTAIAATGKGSESNTFYGKWSYFFDAREYNKVSFKPVDFDLESADLYIFENGSCYFSYFKIKDGLVETDETITGMWIGNDSEITMRFNDVIFKATYSLITGMELKTLTDTYPMVRVPSYDPLAE